ncbi:LysM peptidoglycan-binding domain-containing protein [Antrihabitans cavernicola]|uniref:LysM peptidoglycan-binding domain-containing protein n=1 Tax=Antrihabitans cavernicola TaxID=2495913 RepID=A0A5A7SCR0_9NOCA|nr:LysM peptidoglycan-binding domain-containing protein [Spelaeibacter cavernicola]KAA0023354.1 LysM peptidoglycan-binding domain-containing protein [Spelaeibacter cavernicola]
MSIAVNDFAPAPVADPARRTPARRTQVRRPAGNTARPHSGRVDFGPARVGAPAGVHPLPRRRTSHGPSGAIILCAALLTAVVVMGMLGLAHLRAPAPTSFSGPTTVVQVHGGESLSDVAARVAPDSSVGAVVEQIRQLNNLADAAVHPGQTLIAPAAN